jgi:hypothetical protein
LNGSDVLDCLEAQTRGGGRHSRRPEWRSRIELAISLAVTQCPQWVNLDQFELSALCPVFLDQRMFSEPVGMSKKCQSRHLAPQQNRPLLDHLVGAGKQRRYRAAFLNHALATS